MAIFEGAGVAIVTPMNEDLSVNYEKLAELLDEQIAGGTDAIIICGTTGESATLTVPEHLDVIRFAIKHVNKRIPVIAGTGSNCTVTAIEMSKEAEEAGADGLLAVSYTHLDVYKRQTGERAMRIKDGFVMREVAGQTMVIATGEASRNFHGMIKLNSTGKMIWEGLMQGLSRQEITERILSLIHI